MGDRQQPPTINILNDPLIDFDQAAEEWPTPQKPCLHTIYRAHNNGRNGEYLEAVKIGGRLFTTKAAVHDYLERVCRPKVGKPNGKRRSSKRSKRVLDRAGV